MRKLIVSIGIGLSAMFSLLSVSSCSKSNNGIEDYGILLPVRIATDDLSMVDSLIYHSNGLIAKYKSYTKENGALTLVSYDEFTYTKTTIDQLHYSGLVEGGFGILARYLYHLDGNGRIVSRDDIALGESDITKESALTFEYDARSQMVASETADGVRTVYTWTEGDLTGYGHDDSVCTCFQSPFVCTGYYPYMFDDCEDVLYWQGFYGMLPSHLPASWEVVADTGSAASRYEYNIINNMLTSYKTDYTISIAGMDIEKSTTYNLSWEYVKIL